LTERHKKPKMAQFLKDNEESLEEFNNRNGEKYVREPWMLKVNPSAENTVEIEVEYGQCSGN
jgi:hypothetical protein